MTDDAVVPMDRMKAVRMFKALGVDCQIVGDELDSLAASHPTVRAYLDGDITLAEGLFVEAYLSNGFSAAKAAQTAKYSAMTANGYSAIGMGVLRRPKIKQLIARRLAEQAMEANDVLARMRDVADASMEDFFSVMQIPQEDGNVEEHVIPDFLEAYKQGKFRHLKEFRVDKDGVIHFKLRDQDHALDQLARAAGAFERDNMQKLPPQILALLNLSPQELAGRTDAYDELEDWDDGNDEPTGPGSAPSEPD